MKTTMMTTLRLVSMRWRAAQTTPSYRDCRQPRKRKQHRYNHRHLLRGRRPRHDCLSCLLGNGDKLCSVRKKYIALGRLEQQRQDIISCICTTSPIKQPRNDQFHMHFLILESPFCLSFNSRQGPPFPSLSRYTNIVVIRF
jgi:hypothetical protein